MKVSPLREGSSGSYTLPAGATSSEATVAILDSCPQYATVMLPMPSSMAGSSPSWMVKHCTHALRDLKVWAGGFWIEEPREVMRETAENGDILVWWVAVIGPKGFKKPK
jgi:hypothetical protein